MLSDYAAIKTEAMETYESILCKAGCRKIIGERRYFTEAYTDENKCGFPEKSADALNDASLWEKRK